MASWQASLGQERHWSYQQRFPEAAGFNIPVATLVRGPVDVGIVEAAIRAVAARHESLRSRFGAGFRGLRMDLCSLEDIPVHRHDLRRYGLAERLARLRQLGAAEAGRPFDLSGEPALRAHLVRITDEELVLIINVHHIAFDGWSSPIFFAELNDQYCAMLAGSPPMRPEPRHRYVDFARWQRRQLAAGAYAGELDYWRRVLADPIPPAQWPRAGVADTAPWWAGDMVWLTIPPRLVAAARSAARAFGTTFFALGLATYQLTLQRIVESSRFGVGTALAGRTERRWEEVIGFFVNSVAHPYRHDERLTVRELIARTHREVLGAHDHQRVPYGVVVDDIGPDLVPGRTPFFQTMFLLQNYPSPERKLGPATARSRKLVTGSARYDITFALDTLEGELALELENRLSLVSQDTAIMLARTFFGLLAAVVDNPDVPVGKLAPVDVAVTVHYRSPPEAGLEDLFSGLVANWRSP